MHTTPPSPRNSFGRASRGLAIVVAFGLLATACSDDDDDASPSTSTATTAAPTTEGGSSGDLGPAGFTLGVLLPTPGLLTDAGDSQRRAIELAVADMNEQGGFSEGSVAAIFEQPATGVPASTSLQNLIDDGADAIIGPIGSGDVAGLLPLLDTAGLVACSASATAPGLTQGEPSRRFFRTAVPDPFVIDRLTDEIATRIPAGSRIAIVSRDDQYGAEAGLSLNNTLVALGYETAPVTYGASVVQFADIAPGVASSQAALTIAVTLAEGPRLLTDLISAGVPADTILGLDGMFDPRLAERTFPSDPERANGVSVLATTGGRDLFGRLIADNPTAPLLYAAQAYDCATVLTIAALRAGTGFDPEAMSNSMVDVSAGGVTCSTYGDCKTKLEAGEDIDYDGPSGRIGFNETGDPSSARFTLTSIQAGEIREVQSVDVDLVRDALISAHEAAIAAAVFNTELQQALTVLGYYSGPIDGTYNDELMAAVAAFQTDNGLEPTGQPDEETIALISEKVGTGLSALTGSTAQLQQALTDLGFYSGPIDGRYSAEVVAAVKALQRSIGAPETGIIDAATLQAAYRAGIETGSATATTPPTTAAPAPTTTAPAPPPATDAPATTVEVADTTTTAPIQPTVLDIIKGDPRFSTLAGLMASVAGQVDLTGRGPFTVFAPTNDAFVAFGADRLAQIKADPAALTQLLLHHAVGGQALHTSAMVTGNLTTLADDQVTVTVSPGTIEVAPATIIIPDLVAGNGVVHGIDAVLAE